MIVKMSKVAVLASASDINQSLVKLRKFGLLHIKHINPPSGENVARLEKDLEDSVKVISMLSGKSRERESLPFEAAEIAVKDTLHILFERKQLLSRKEEVERKLSWFEDWGRISYGPLKELSRAGVFLKLYIVNKKEFKSLPSDKPVFLIKRERRRFYIVFASQNKNESLEFEEVLFPDQDPFSLKKELKTINNWLEDISLNLDFLSSYRGSFEKYRKTVSQQLEFFKVRAGMAEEEGFCYIQGFLPKEEAINLRNLVKKEGLALLAEEPGDVSEVPTFIRNPRWVNIIKPVFQFMGTVPGYNEYDISGWFLVFLSLFFALLIGDAGYGLVFLLITLISRRAFKTAPQEVFSLMYVFSLSTVAWGAVSGTWFGAEQIAKLPFFNRLIIERINSFTASNQGFMIYLCFLIGVVHLSIAHGIAAFRYINSRIALGQIGWISVLWGLFFVAGKLVLNRPLPHVTMILLVTGIIMVMLFSAEGSFKKSLLSLSDLPLNVISSFSDIVSYLRLFAVGYATVIVASSFNNMAFNIGGPALLKGFIAAIILFLGHGLNIVLGLMAIIVHGIRLNMLEFSGHLNMQWSGKEYAPFKE